MNKNNNIALSHCKMKTFSGSLLFALLLNILTTTSVNSYGIEYCRRPFIEGAMYDPFYSEYPIGGTLEVWCGYNVEEARAFLCLPSGEWDRPLPVCVYQNRTEVPLCKVRELANGNTTPELDFYEQTTKVAYACNEGYILVGNYTSMCFGDDKWNSVMPICQVGCKAPEYENGYIEPEVGVYNDYFRLGQDVVFHCRLNFVPWSVTATCMENGKWSEEPNPCIKEERVILDRSIFCETPVVAHARVSPELVTYILEYYTPGTTISFLCDQGYVLVGDNTATCSPIGEWSKPLPTCKVGCPTPVVVYGEVKPEILGILDYYRVGEVVTFQCEANFRLSGSSYAECQDSGDWSARIPECIVNERVGCERPVLTNGYYQPILSSEKRLHPEGDLIFFQCSPGYKLVGASLVTCGLDQQWNAEIPKCEEVKKTVGCLPPPFFDNGYYSPANTGNSRFQPGTKLTFVCRGKHVIRGSKYARCLESGKWDTLPVCVDGCLPQAVNHGTFEPSLSKGEKYYPFRKTVRVRCAKGYYSFGSSTSTCQSNGLWSAAMHCAAGCVIPNILRLTVLPRKSNGVNVYKVGSKVRFSCDSGYVIKGALRSQCQSNGKWTTKIPTCEKPVFCFSPGELKLGYFTPNRKRYRPGSIVQWFCHSNNVLRGQKFSKCGTNGLFRPLKPTCAPSKGGSGNAKPGSYDITRHACKAPRIPDGGIIPNMKSYYAIQNEVEFVCKKGYRLFGSARAICRTRQGFTPQPPICKRVECSQPRKPNYGEVVQLRDRYYYSDKVEYICNQDYTMYGSKYAICHDDGQMKPGPPECRPPSCRYDCKRVEGRPCQCDITCEWDDNCCSDFSQYCRKVFYK